MGGFDPARAHEILKVPADVTPIAMIAVGYQGELSELNADFIEGENAERERNDLSAAFFDGEWGAPFGTE
jgi:hypothetical protein